MNYHVSGPVPRHASPPHTHNKHTPSPVRPNHTAQREHINYRCTLNYFHYLSRSVDGTETGMMDGKGSAIPPRVVNAPCFTFLQPFSSPFIPYVAPVPSAFCAFSLSPFVSLSQEDTNRFFFFFFLTVINC